MPTSRFLHILDFVDGHFREDITLTGVAAKFGYSPFHLTRLFKQETGVSFGKYLGSKRLSTSRELLGIMSVTETCFEVGFENLSHFSRRFKSRFGVNPSAYQKARFSEGLTKRLFADEELGRRCLGQPVVSFVEQYYRRILQTFAEISDREMVKIQDIADRCVRSLKAGHWVSVISYESEGYRVELSAGGPRVGARPEIRRSWQAIQKYYDPVRQSILASGPRFSPLPEMGEGDILITACLFPGIRDCARAGAEVIGLGTMPAAASPPGVPRSRPAGEATGLEGLPGQIISCHLPAEDGLVAVPELPHTPFAPASTLAHAFIRGSLRAKIDRAWPRPRGDAEPDLMKDAAERLAGLSGYSHDLKEIGTQIAERVIAGGKLYIIGSPLALNEFTWRGAGLMGLQPLRAGQGTDKDVAVIDASLGLDANLRSLVSASLARGVYAIVVYPGPAEESLPCLSAEPEAIIKEASGQPARTGGDGGREARRPSFVRLSCWTLLWMLFSSYLQKMIIRGQVPFVFRGFDLPGGTKYNEAVYPACLERGY